MESDPYEFYRSQPYDPNDPSLVNELRNSPLPDNGQKVAGTRNLSVEDLAKLNEQHADQTLITHLPAEQREQVEEYLVQHGINPPRKRKYF